MDNTNCGSECSFVKSGFCTTDKECPNYVESCWLENQTGQQKFIRDCVPKRLMIQNNMQQIRIEGLQQALEQQRNSFLQMGSHFTQLLSEVNKLVLSQSQVNQLPNENDCKKLLYSNDESEDIAGK